MGKCKICNVKEEIPGTGFCFDCRPNVIGQSKYSKEKSGGSMENQFIFNTLFSDSGKKVLRPEIFKEAAKEFATKLYNNKMGRSQIRNFLRYLRGLEILLRLPSGPNFSDITWQLDELYSYTIYQSSRDKQPYPKIFKEIFEAYLPLLKSDQREFEAFVKFMASVYAYYTAKESEEKEHRNSIQNQSRRDRR